MLRQLEGFADPVGDLHETERAWIDLPYIDGAREIPAPRILACALLAVGIIASRHEHTLPQLSRPTTTPSPRFSTPFIPTTPQIKVSVFCGDKLIAEITRLSFFDEADRERFGPLDRV
jgi:hypothetical protein